MKQLVYNKISKVKLFEKTKFIWNDRLANHIEHQIHKGTFQYEINDLKSLPKEIAHLHFLWRAQCEFGGSGAMYLYQAQAEEIIGIYNALNEVDAVELSALFSKAIAVANLYGTTAYFFEIQNSEFKKWFEKFTDSGGFKDLEDKILMKKLEILSTEYLNEKILKYIHQNLDLICE